MTIDRNAGTIGPGEIDLAAAKSLRMRLASEAIILERTWVLRQGVPVETAVACIMVASAIAAIEDGCDRATFVELAAAVFDRSLRSRPI